MSGATVSGGAICVVVGTRPDAIKLAPVIQALKAHPRLRPIVLASGQHREMLAAALAAFDIVADSDLGLMRAGQSPVAVLAAAITGLAAAIDVSQPAALIVQGDTTTAVAAAHAAFLGGIPIAHVEAGLRSGSLRAPFPEEGNRRLIAQIASVHFAPTLVARDALLREGIEPTAIHVTGNTGIDALRQIEAQLSRDEAFRRRVAAALPQVDSMRPLLVVTAHRRETHGAALHAIADALLILAAGGLEIVMPVHPNPAVAGPLRARLAGAAHVHLVAPLDYPAFIALLGRADAVLTDSGGIQEEAPALGVPVLVLRDVTERSEGLATGNARLVGTDTAAIVAAVRDLLDNSTALARMSQPALPYGDGDATPRIVTVLDRLYGLETAHAELSHQV